VRPSSREIFGNDSKQHMAIKLRAVNTNQQSGTVGALGCTNKPKQQS
jgi:hypothetical protein